MSKTAKRIILAVILLLVIPLFAIVSLLFVRAYFNAGDSESGQQTLLPAWLADFFPERNTPPPEPLPLSEREWLDSPFAVYCGYGSAPFDTLIEAFEFVSGIDRTAYIYTGFRRVWDNRGLNVDSAQINAPLIMQMPALHRGCGVVSLAMLLAFHGLDVDKMVLAEEIRTIPFPGDPNEGFVGCIFSFDNPGLGVYHAPIFELMLEYIPDVAIDLTGLPFEVMLYYVANNRPVWVVTNFLHRPLTEYSFDQWPLPGGREVRVSWHMHSVLVTGFSQTHVYFNDPLYNPDRVNAPPTFYRAPIADFAAAWEQFGNQMVAVLPLFR